MNTFGPNTYLASNRRTPGIGASLRDRLVLALLAASVLGLTGCSRIILSAEDAIVRDDGRTTLVANVERERVRDVRVSLADVNVRFAVDGKVVGHALTDSEGRAALEATVDPGIREFEVVIKHKGGRHDHHGRVFHWQSDKTIVAVDIDETVSSTSYRVLLFHDEDNKSNPLQDSSDTLCRLAEDFQVVYLTGRPRFLWEKTRRWLDRHHFPAGPIVTAPGLRQCILQRIFKRVELAELRKSWPGALIGIGDRGADINAYHRNGMLTLLVGGTETADPQRHIYRLGKWRAIAEFCDSNRAVLSNPERLDAALKSGDAFLLPGAATGIAARPEHADQISNATVVK